MLVSDRWATNCTVRERFCSRDLELLVVSFRPFYLPREFGQITVILAYVPGPDYDLAGERIAEAYNNAIAKSTDQPIFILGDFNQCKLSRYIPGLHQYVSVKTRLNATLDKCYGNIDNAYVSKSRPALGRSDHNVIHLLPRYRQKIKTEKPKAVEKQIWDSESTLALQSCFEVTDWEIFTSITDPEELVDHVTSYIKFCEESMIKTKTVKVFPNNKPWLSKELKVILNEKKLAHIRGDKLGEKMKMKEFNSKKVIEKKKYKDKTEEKFTKGDLKEAWNGLNTMMGKTSQQIGQRLPDTPDPVNDLNNYYARFDVRDLRSECDSFCKDLPPQHLELEESHVKKVFNNIKVNKAAGPDGIRGKVIKTCSSQLCKIFTYVFQFLLNSHIMPKAWKTSTIIPLPKNSKARQLNDFRPVALTPILAKCFESVLCKHLKSDVMSKLDPLQFAYKAKRGVDDACLTLVNLVAKHVQHSKNFCRILMIDFSSAFNSIEPLILLRRLADLGVNNNLILFINDFLKERPQRVLANGIFSEELVLSTGAPQGCVLSPTLFSIYTDEIRFNNDITTLFKFADDMALVGLLTSENSLSSYFSDVERLREWCSNSFLELNVKKTKELVFDERSEKSDFVPIKISNEKVEVVETFKYLGTIIDSKLNFSDNADMIFKKCQQRLFLLRKLKSFFVSKEILQLVYRSLIESILTFNMGCWYGSLSFIDRKKLSRIVNLASKIVGTQQPSLESLYQKWVGRKAKSITSLTDHPLLHEFQTLPRGRFRVPICNRRYKRTFIPSAISILNANFQR